MENGNCINPSGTKGFGTYIKHGRGGVRHGSPRYLKNDKCYRPETLGGVSFKVSKSFKMI